MIEQEQPRKVAFVGTSCIGKTTLLEYYRQRYSGNSQVAFVEEAARVFFQANPEITDRFSEESQGKVQALALQNEQAAYNSGVKVILCDRSVIDAVAYVKAHGDPEGSDRLLDNVSFWLPTYHKFLLLDPIGVPYATDEVRLEDSDKRQQFHDAFVALFSEKEIPYELLSGTLEERISRVDEILTSND